MVTYIPLDQIDGEIAIFKSSELREGADCFAFWTTSVPLAPKLAILSASLLACSKER